jgi:hypothetical protein
MSRHHLIPSNVARRLRPSAERFAAAAALQDPSLMLHLQAARSLPICAPGSTRA